MRSTKTSLTRPALSQFLSVFLPTPEQTMLLRACLWSGQLGREAWAEWCENVEDPLRVLRDGDETVKGLLPLISVALSRNGIVVDETLRTCLRTAALREELRINTYRRILSQVLSAFAEKEIPTIVLNGAALAETVYQSSSIRHTGVIEILMENFEPLRAVSSMYSLGFSQVGEANFKSAELKFKHDSGLPMTLYRTLFTTSYYDVPPDDIWVRSQSKPIAEVTTRILSPADSLIHVCGNAFFSRSRRTLLWVFDGWFTISKYPNLDWDQLQQTIRRSHLELPLSATIGYLAETLEAPVPLSFLENLYADASKTEWEGISQVFLVTRREVGKNYIKMFLMAGNWRVRLHLLSWIVRYPMGHARWFWRNCYPRLFLARYLLGPLLDLARRTLSVCKSLVKE